MNSDYAACRELWGVIHSPLSIKVRCACALLVFLPSTFLASPVLAAPTPADDTAVVSEDSSATTIDVAANDGSDAVPTSVTLVSSPPNGTASNNGDGSFDYTPDLNHSGSDIFTYSICDLIPECATATVNIVVDPVNDAPVITGQASPLSTPEDQSLTIGLANLLVTDVDPDDVYPTGFSLQLQAGENYSFSGTTVTPAENFNGELDVTVFVTDPDELQSGTFDLAVSVLPINDLPIAVADTADVAEDSLNNPVEVLLNDFDPDGDTLSVTSFSAGNGTVSVLGNGTLRYTPDTNYFGADIIDYTISDGNGGTASTTVAVTVNPVPDFPVAADDVAAVLEDSEDNLIDVTANDSDPDGDTLTVTLASATNGSATPSNGSVNYTPNANFSGADTISYTISDGTGRTDTATVAVTVTGQNDPPVANDDVANVEEDSSTNIINVTENDTDPDGDTLTVSAASTLTGTVLPSGTDVVYTPPADFVGVAIINYTVSDGNGGTDDAIVTVTVSNQNDPPVAVDDVAVVTEDTADNSINVAANDSDQDGDLLTVSSASALNGTAIPNVSSVVYTPNTDFSGLDTISYTISDGNGGTDSATVAVTVSPLNDPPVIDGLVAPLSTTEDQSITITLRDLSVTDVDPDDVYPTGFTLQLNAGVNYTVSGNVVTPDENFSGQISVPATVTDPDGLVSQLFAIPITVTAVNDAPVANDDTATVTEDSSNNLIDVTANDTDDDGDSLSVIAASAANGTAAPSAGNVSYTPNPDFSGADTINYTISDGNGGTDTATVAVTVTAVNDAPVIIGLTSPLSTPEDQSITIGLDDLIVTDADLDDVYPAGFSLQLQDGANYTAVGTIVTPAENFNGQITVPATVTDPDGLVSQVFSIPITVTAVNDIPTLDTPIADQTAIENSPFSLDISGNFSDADGDTLTFSASGLPASNNITLNAATGVISGTPRIEDARDNDPYVVTVTARDPLGETTIGTFDLTISALDRANLALSIDVSPDTGLPNDDLRWTFTALNPLGPQPGSNVELRGSFVGSGLTVTAENGANCTIDPTVDLVTSFVCVLGTLPVGASTPTVITTTTSEATEVVAFATAAGAENLPIDPNEEDNSAVEAAGVADAFSVGAVQILGSTSIRSVAAGDVNVDPAGDSVADIVVGTAAGQPVQIYLNDAPRESCDCPRDFLVTPLSIPDTGSNEGVALADLDDDGDLDLVVANGGGQPDRVFANDGDGNFSAVATLEPSFAQAVAIADFDLDGNLDIAIAEIGARNRVYLGDGTGGFPGGPVLLGNAGQSEANSFDVAVADLNGDGRPDLVFANVDSPSEVWFADAAAGFVSGGQLPVGDAVSVAAGDLNGDGRADLVFGRVPAGVGDVPSNPVLVNDGTGGFGEPAALLGISPTNDVHIGDVNNDGSPDLVFINASGVHQIWTANGGGFSLHREQIIDIDAMAGVLANLGHTDTDVPGGLDLAMGGAASAGVGVYLNDAAGNLGRGDVEPPVISLNGSGSVSIESGLQYSDAGAAADDNIDGDVSADIRVTNNVNTAIVGSYTVSYNVTDFAGNAAVTVTRTVNVTPAAGSGGGGGGSISYWAALVLLGFLAAGAFGRSGVRAIRVRADTRKYKDI